jgi:translocation and assembly module TamA
MQTSIACPLFLAVALLLSGCSDTNDLGEILPFSGTFGGGVAYDVEFEGELDKELQKLIQQSSQLIALRREPSPSRAALRRRISGDTEKFQAVLRSEGFYSGSVEPEVDDSGDRIHITFRIDPGPRYSLASYTIDYIGDHTDTDNLPRDAARLDANPGMPARGEDIVAIEERLLQDLENTGRPLAEVAERRAVVDHDTRTMTVELRVDPGPPVVFGPLAIDRLEKVEEDYVRDLVAWPEGEVFDQRILEDARRTLSKTNLFRSVRLESAEQVTADNRLPVTARVEESKHRTLSAGLTYTTSEGVGGDVSWEHRNLSGRQETLVLSAHLSEIRQQATATFVKPNFRIRDQSLIVNTTARAQHR